MKIYTRIKIDIESGRVLEEDSFEYGGLVALCRQDSSNRESADRAGRSGRSGSSNRDSDPSHRDMMEHRSGMPHGGSGKGVMGGSDNQGGYGPGLHPDVYGPPQNFPDYPPDYPSHRDMMEHRSGMPHGGSGAGVMGGENERVDKALRDFFDPIDDYETRLDKGEVGFFERALNKLRSWTSDPKTMAKAAATIFGMLAAAVFGPVVGAMVGKGLKEAIDKWGPDITPRAIAQSIYGSLSSAGVSDEQISAMMSDPRTETALEDLSSNEGLGQEYFDTTYAGFEDTLSQYGETINPTTGQPYTVDEQVRRLFETTGTDMADYPVGDQLDQYLARLGQAGEAYTEKSAGITQDWEDFENYYRGLGEDLLTDYDTIRSKYDTALEGMPQEYDRIRSGYDRNIASIPSLNMKLPGVMGGGSIPLAPNRWADMYSGIAGTQLGVSNSKYGQLSNQFQNNLNALTGQRNTINDMAGQSSTGIANRQNLMQNDYNVAMDQASRQKLPLDIALDLLRIDKGIQGQIDVADAGKPDRPKWYETFIPAAAYTMGALL